MGVFTGWRISLELDSTFGAKKKQELRALIASNGGTISFIVTRKVLYKVYIINKMKLFLKVFYVNKNEVMVV